MQREKMFIFSTLSHAQAENDLNIDFYLCIKSVNLILNHPINQHGYLMTNRLIQSESPKGEYFVRRNQRVFVPHGYLAVGKIIGVHGLRGEVKIELHTDFPERFEAGAVLRLGDELLPMQIMGARPHKSHMLVRFEGVNSRNEADQLRNYWLFVDENDAMELEDGVFWIHDIMGLKVQTEEGRSLGKVKDVLLTGANEVYVVQTDAQVNRGKDLLLPAIADVVQQVDLNENVLIVRLQPGLLDE
ncbi:ribosome maturation factor RimM [Chloroflexi bacterium TSY]|nr:ribosome maturation factor RimM [Chloroflexi bacterium TSY]